LYNSLLNNITLYSNALQQASLAEMLGVGHAFSLQEVGSLWCI
jgi:hypothetical protein